MANYIKGSALRELLLGVQVVKSAQTLPQTATSTLYTVAGGSVLVTGLLGLVSTVIGSTATTLSLGTVPTTGTAEAAGIATATAITSSEAGTWMGPLAASAKGGALAVGSDGGKAIFLNTPFVVPAGTISWTTSASTTGAVTWYLTYVPLDTGASVS
jgi:hypothetical protein